MDGDTSKGFFIGCATASLMTVVGIFLFVLMCGWLMRGCVEAGGDDAMQGKSEAKDRPEEEVELSEAWVAGDPAKDAVKVIRVRLNGVIQEEKSRASLLGIKDDDTASVALRHINAASRDKGVRGLWISINSPGGSVTMSDRLHEAIEHFRKSGKDRFVFVHMGDLCCSGGYYAAVAATHIMARPTTMTGSIGVIISGLNAAKLAEKIGLESVTIASAENKDLLNPLKRVNPEHVAILRKPLQQMYDRFVSLVAKGRSLSEEKVRLLADGRVFSAEDALEEKLIDSIGHDREAMAAVRKLAGKDKVHVCRYREKPSIERFLENSILFESTGGFRNLFKEIMGEMIESSNNRTIEFL